MSWIAISDGRRTSRLPEITNGDEPRLLTSGSLVLETVFTAEQDRPQTLIEMDRTSEWHRRIRMTLRADGEIYVEHRQGRETTRALLRLRQPDPDAVLRLTFAWDGPGRNGLLSAENLDTGWLDQVVFDDPQPWPIDDIAVLASGKDGCRIDHSVSLLAFSDRVEPVGMPLGLVATSVIETAAGPCKVQDLRPGDLVITAEGGLQPVRWVVAREVPCLGQFAPIRLRAPFFGLNRDLNLSPEHRILIEGADAEYLFGADAVLVEARHLTRMSAASRHTTTGTVKYVQVILDSHECIFVCGAWAESLYLGHFADRPTSLANSILANIPAQLLPRHTRVANPLLKSFEAVVLVSAMCA